jgi:DNA/RNA-binding protein KIN17
MPKAEKGTPKDIGNRIKAKGLQKLKFYCQMCEKQCRDANGFKCHMTSEAHLRNMKIFSQNASGIMENMSKDFEKTYVDTLRRRHGTKRVNANNIYQEQIADKEHIHMNSTKWASLADFIQYLGKTGKCVVDETERGWYVQYIERDAGIISRQETQRKRAEADHAAEERYAKQLVIQKLEAAKMLDRAGGVFPIEASNLNRERDFSFTLSLGVSKKASTSTSASLIAKPVFGEDDDELAISTWSNETPIDKMTSRRILPASLSKPAIAKASTSHEKRKNGDGDTHAPSKTKFRKETNGLKKENWICRDILVRIISQTLANGKYYNRKAVLENVLEDKFTADVVVLDSGPTERDGGDVIRLDQDDLESVVPKEGKRVRILNGFGRGMKATVVSLDRNKCKAKIELEDGTILEQIAFQHISKVAG